MGKTSSWLRRFLTAKKDKKETYLNNQNSSILIPQPTSKERRRWSFRRSSATSKDKNSNPNQSNAGHFSDSQIDKAVKNTATIEDTAATRIQSAFRSYLARKALFALRGLVKLQALVRGHLVRKRTTATLRCMQALMTAQARARAQRLRMPGNSKTSTPRHYFQGKYNHYETERGMEENIKIVEVDLGEHKANQQKDRIHGHFDGYYSSTTAQSSPKFSSSSRHDQSKPSPNFAVSKPSYVESQATHDCSFYPSYMANTESSRAKARSQSAPKTRPPDWLESQPSRRRVSLKGRHCPRPVRTMQRSSSQAGYATQNYENPWAIKLDKSSVSLKASECGSTSTVFSSTNYCRSVAAYDTHGNPSPW